MASSRVTSAITRLRVRRSSGSSPKPRGPMADGLCGADVDGESGSGPAAGSGLPLLDGKLGNGSIVVVPHNGDGRANAHATKYIVHVGIRQGDAAGRPILATAAPAMDLDEAADSGRRRYLTAAARAAEPGAVFGIGVVEEQGLVIDRRQIRHPTGHPVSALGRCAVAFVRLVGDPIDAQVDLVGLHWLAAHEERQQVRFLDYDDCRPALTPGPGDGLFLPCLLYTSDAADDLLCVDLGGRRII